MSKYTIKEFFMLMNRKIVISTIIFGIIHFVAQIVVLVVLFGYGMALFDDPMNYRLEFFTKIWDILFNILSFPILFISLHITTKVFDSSYVGWIPFVLNSIFWSCVFYWSLKRLKKFRENNEKTENQHCKIACVIL